MGTLRLQLNSGARANIQGQRHHETSSINPADLQSLPDNLKSLFLRPGKYTF